MVAIAVESAMAGAAGGVIVAAIGLGTGLVVPIGMAAEVDPVPCPSLHPERLVDTTRADAGAVGGVTIEAEVEARVVSNSVAMVATTKNVAIVRISLFVEVLRIFLFLDGGTFYSFVTLQICYIIEAPQHSVSERPNKLLFYYSVRCNLRISFPHFLPSFPRMTGSESLLLPMITTLELGDSAIFSVASIPFHCRRLGVIPLETMF